MKVTVSLVHIEWLTQIAAPGTGRSPWNQLNACVCVCARSDPRMNAQEMHCNVWNALIRAQVNCFREIGSPFSRFIRLPRPTYWRGRLLFLLWIFLIILLLLLLHLIITSSSQTVRSIALIFYTWVNRMKMVPYRRAYKRTALIIEVRLYPLISACAYIRS
jgi:hypothetical protein